MEIPTDTKVNPTYSMKSGFLARVQFERTPIMADITAHYCANPLCQCRTVTLNFYDASGRFDDRLFKLDVNYETWQLESSEIFKRDLYHRDIAEEFMDSLNDRFKAEILSKIEPKARWEHPLQDDIDLSGRDPNCLVLYREIYRTEPFEDILFELDGKIYFVLDHYCPRPKCDCNDVVLSFYLIDDGKINNNPLLAYKVEFETGRGTVVHSSAGVSLRQAKDLYGGLSKVFGGYAISFFENRYRKIKEWGEVYFGVKDTQKKMITPKTGRNDPCPCGSGRKYKKCCGSGNSGE